MTIVNFKSIKYSFATVLFGIAVWLLLEDFRRPPAESNLKPIRGIVASTEYLSNRNRDGVETRQRVRLSLQGSRKHFTFLGEQPGFGAALGLKPGDQVELRVDPWWLPHPASFDIYSLTVNGQEVATYQQHVEVLGHGSYSCLAVVFALLGCGALAISDWGTTEQKNAYPKLSWLRTLLGQ